MIYRCCDTLRRNLVAASPTLNGIDYLEVIDRDLPGFDPLRQRTLLVHCLKPLPATFSAANVKLIGGERVRNVKVQWAAPAAPLPAQLAPPAEAATAAIIGALDDAANVLVVRTATTGDFSAYTLRLVDSALTDDPPANVDPRLADIDFCFKVECPSDFDCQPQRYCPPAIGDAPDIDYLAKDYSSFRRLLLDRMAQLVPQWQQSSAADTGIAVAELLAYAADRLSYQQDAIATETYLNTARRRVSVRRLALLADYHMHDGCNARAWLQLQAAAPQVALPLDELQFLTRLPGLPPGILAGSQALATAMLLLPQVYEPVRPPALAPGNVQALFAAQNRIAFHTWSDDRCGLPKGATRATLKGHQLGLKRGDALLFEEVLGPATGRPGDADPRHRHVVCLSQDPRASVDPLTNDPITEIEWPRADALPFPLCISGVTDAAHGNVHLAEISVARGNLLLVDHGATLTGEALGAVPPPTAFLAPAVNADRCDPPARQAIPPRFRPALAAAPLTQAAGRFALAASGMPGTVAGPFAAAADAFDWSLADVVPQIALDGQAPASQAPPTRWQARRQLLDSPSDATDLVVEIDDDGVANLRFGDDQLGQRPNTGTAFTASYRVGNGAPGNVGANAIVHLVGPQPALAQVLGVRNPLPATGGLDPESSDSVRRNAPEAFRTQQRAVTTADYAAVTERDPQVQRAAASLRWTGSWHTVFITADPWDGVDPLQLKVDLAAEVERYRMAGHDLVFDDPGWVSLDLALHVCVKDDYFRSQVRQGLLQALGKQVLPDGRRGLFHADNFTFGQPVYLSPIYAAARQVPGVASVQVTRFQRLGRDDVKPLIDGVLAIGALEIARLDNDRDFPERGVLRLDLHGGQ